MAKPRYINHGDLSGDLCFRDGTPMVVHQTEDNEWIIICPECSHEVPHCVIGTRQDRPAYAWGKETL